MKFILGGLVHGLLLANLGACFGERTKTFEWNITYTTANPDGNQARRVIGVNGKWPPPIIEVEYNDTIVLKVNNKLDDAMTGLHAHGIFQNGKNYFDGVVGITQCPIPAGAGMIYNFTVTQLGTYWIHSHVPGQYIDGLRAPLIIYNPAEPYQYDHDITVTVSDWYHQESKELASTYTMSPKNPTGMAPIPQSALINDGQNTTIIFSPAQTYRLRFVNIGAYGHFRISITDHEMTVIEVDGVYVQSHLVSVLKLAPGQRVSVLVKAKCASGGSYALIASMDTSIFGMVPDTLNLNSTAWISYNNVNKSSTEEAQAPSSLMEFEDMKLVPLVPQGVSSPDQTLRLDVTMGMAEDNTIYSLINNISYREPIVPTLLTVLTAPTQYLMDPTIYGASTNPFIFQPNKTIRVIVNNMDMEEHPCPKTQKRLLTT